jgi:hypothetical protein
VEAIRAVEGHAGAPPADPRILVALWLYATVRSIGSARELARRCDPQQGEVPFQWICGGVSMNHHTLSDFRVGPMELLDQLLTEGVAVLRHEGLVDLADDSPSVAAWRQRMGSDEAKEIYKERASTAECVNAIARNRGLQQFRVRGLRKVRAVLLWYVLAHNLIRAATLRAERSQEAATTN